MNLVDLNQISTVDGFKAAVATIQAISGYKKPQAFAFGYGEYSPAGKLLCVHFHTVNHKLPDGNYENQGSAAIFTYVCGRADSRVTDGQYGLLEKAFKPFIGSVDKPHPNIDAFKIAKAQAKANSRVHGIFVAIDDLQVPAKSVADAYLRLHLLSFRKVLPNTINMNGIFGILPNVTWTDQGAFDAETWSADVAAILMDGGSRPNVKAQDKFPRLLDFVTLDPSIRIVDSGTVRLGAYLGNGTTVMPSGFVNYNAGTLGKSMVEGRISQGVVVGDGSDLGGGSSTMGTLSGGGKQIISIGDRCLIGANAGTGISLGNDCKIEAGLYITVNTRVFKPNMTFAKGLELSGQHGMTFFRGQDGSVCVVPTKGKVELNPALHA